MPEIWCDAWHQVSAEDPRKPTPGRLPCGIPHLGPSTAIEHLLTSSHQETLDFLLIRAQVNDIARIASVERDSDAWLSSARLAATPSPS